MTKVLQNTYIHVNICFPVAQDVEEKPERPTKTGNSIYPVLNKYTERSQCVKEFTTTKNK